MTYFVLGRFGLLLKFAQLVELTVFLLQSNGLVESTQLLELTVSLLHSNELSGCSISPLAYHASADDVSADVFGVLCIRWDVTWWSQCQY